MTVGGDETDGLFAGRFVLGDLLGVGGSAAVYEAEDTAVPAAEAGIRTAEVPRRVALKVLHQHLAWDAAVAQAFLGEARAAARVRHPNVAAVLDSGVADSGGVPQAWIATELVAGGSLAERVAARGPLSPVEAAAVLDGVLAALGAAHGEGLVHRDVTPANVLLARPAGAGPVEANDVRLVDFGLADATGRPALAGGLPGTPSAGSAGAVVGSAHYVSPEQAQGKPVRAAGDRYQAGALLYFALTGQPPFPRATAADVLAAHVSAPPPVPSALVPAARPLDRVVTRAMAKAPVRRFRDAAEFRSALAAAVAPLRDGLVVPGDDPAAGDPDPAVDRAVAAGDDDLDTGGTRVLAPGSGRFMDYLEPAVAARQARLSATPAKSSSGGVVAGVAVVVVLGLGLWGALAAAASPTTNAGPTATPAPTLTAPPTPTPTPTARTPLPGTVPTAGPTGEPTPDPTPSVDPTPTPSSGDPLMPVPSPTPTPAATTPATVAVPELSGSLSDAQRALYAAGLVLGTVTKTNAPQPADRVLGQSPAVGREVAPGSRVDLTVASGSNTVPPVTGLTLSAAADALRAAGFVVPPAAAGTPPDATVAATQPAAGTLLVVGSTVTLVPAEPAPTGDPTSDPTDASTSPGPATSGEVAT